MEKFYERTGIKEEKNIREKESKILKKQKHEERIKKNIKRGIYKSNCQNICSLDLMSFEKEYEKVEYLLKCYLDFLPSFDENIQSLIQGYSDYFDRYGMNMTPFGLRNFRKGIEKTILVARKQLKSLKEDNVPFINEKREDALIDFCIQYFSDLDGKDMNLTIIANLWCFLDDAKIPFIGFKDLELSKKRVRDIWKELRED